MPKTWKNDVEFNFRSNLDRVRGILETYTNLVASRSGRPSVQQTDILRAAVVFLHATLEDLLRTIAQVRLPFANPKQLDQIPLRVGQQAKTTFSLGALAEYRDLTVDDVIRDAVTDYLKRSNYNNPGEVAKLLESVGLDKELIGNTGGSLGAMMSRRHMIVHRADKNPISGSGHHIASSLNKRMVESWLNTVEEFGFRVIANL